jgi:Uma2 family endonuclease
MAMNEQLIQSETSQANFPLVAENEVIDREKQIEIVDGEEEIKNMSGAKAGGIATRLIGEIFIYLKTNKIGRVYGPDTMFTIGKNNRMPDVAFVSNKKIPKKGEPFKKWGFAPSLAIEVISPNDVYDKIFDKINDYFKAGVKQVWLVEPRFERIRIYKSPEESITLKKQDELTCEEILPDFKLPLTEIFID